MASSNPNPATPKGCRRVDLDGVTYFVNPHRVVFRLVPDTALGTGYAIRFPSLSDSRRVIREQPGR